LIVPAAGRVQRAEHEVARLRRPDRGLDRLEVAHLADEDHVRVLTQGTRRSASAKLGHVVADLALVDDRLLVLVVVLDRVFHRDDVAVEVRVDVVDHRRQRRGLARAGRPGDEEQATRPADQFLADGGRPICSNVSSLLGI
jgi:hypothetical protein